MLAQVLNQAVNLLIVRDTFSDSPEPFHLSRIIIIFQANAKSKSKVGKARSEPIGLQVLKF